MYHNIKEKIQRSEYIDLCTLLSNNPNKKKTQKLSLGRKGDNDDAVTLQYNHNIRHFVSLLQPYSPDWHVLFQHRQWMTILIAYLLSS
jgi:hypothetical protein